MILSAMPLSRTNTLRQIIDALANAENIVSVEKLVSNPLSLHENEFSDSADILIEQVDKLPSLYEKNPQYMPLCVEILRYIEAKISARSPELKKDHWFQLHKHPKYYRRIYKKLFREKPLSFSANFVSLYFQSINNAGDYLTDANIFYTDNADTVSFICYALAIALLYKNIVTDTNVATCVPLSSWIFTCAKDSLLSCGENFATEVLTNLNSLFQPRLVLGNEPTQGFVPHVSTLRLIQKLVYLDNTGEHYLIDNKDCINALTRLYIEDALPYFISSALSISPDLLIERISEHRRRKSDITAVKAFAIFDEWLSFIHILDCVWDNSIAAAAFQLIQSIAQDRLSGTPEMYPSDGEQSLSSSMNQFVTSSPNREETGATVFSHSILSYSLKVIESFKARGHAGASAIAFENYSIKSKFLFTSTHSLSDCMCYVESCFLTGRLNEAMEILPAVANTYSTQRLNFPPFNNHQKKHLCDPAYSASRTFVMEGITKKHYSNNIISYLPLLDFKNDVAQRILFIAIDNFTCMEKSAQSEILRFLPRDFSVLQSVSTLNNTFPNSKLLENLSSNIVEVLLMSGSVDSDIFEVFMRKLYPTGSIVDAPVLFNIVCRALLDMKSRQQFATGPYQKDSFDVILAVCSNEIFTVPQEEIDILYRNPVALTQQAYIDPPEDTGNTAVTTSIAKDNRSSVFSTKLDNLFAPQIIITEPQAAYNSDLMPWVRKSDDTIFTRLTPVQDKMTFFVRGHALSVGCCSDQVLDKISPNELQDCLILLASELTELAILGHDKWAVRHNDVETGAHGFIGDVITKIYTIFNSACGMPQATMVAIELQKAFIAFVRSADSLGAKRFQIVLDTNHQTSEIILEAFTAIRTLCPEGKRDFFWTTARESKACWESLSSLVLDAKRQETMLDSPSIKEAEHRFIATFAKFAELL